MQALEGIEGVDEGVEVLSGLIDEDQDGLQLSPKYKGKRIAAESKKREGKGRGRSPPPPIESPPIKSHPEEVYSMYKYGEFTKPELRDLQESAAQMIESLPDSWDNDDGHDFKWATGVINVGGVPGPPISRPVFIKKMSADLEDAWLRESDNLFHLLKCKHVPIFYCSLRKGEEFYIITELVTELGPEDNELLKELPDYLDEFHALNYFHGDLGTPENIMVAEREGIKKLVFIDLDDTYHLSENHTRDTGNEGNPFHLNRDDKISAFKLSSTDDPTDDEKHDIFKACDRFSLMYSLLSLLDLKRLLPSQGETELKGGHWVGCNCLFETTSDFYKAFIPNPKVVSTTRECRGERVGDGHIFWNFTDTKRLVNEFHLCYDIFVSNLKGGLEDLFHNWHEGLSVALSPDLPLAALNSGRPHFKKKKKKQKKKKTKKKKKKTNRKLKTKTTYKKSRRK
jgi:hypothetical protein